MARRSLAALFCACLFALLVPPTSAQPARPGLYDLPFDPIYARALMTGTRTVAGVPGPGIWESSAHYAIDATLDPRANRLDGQQRATYYNASPDTLRHLVMKLRQNLHAPGVQRNRPVEITGGMLLGKVSVDGRAFEQNAPEDGTAGRYEVAGTVMTVFLEQPLAPGDSALVDMGWSFRVPQAGPLAVRMGQDGEVFFLAYWYPQFAVYDDVRGWHTEPYLGLAEHYMDWADYDLSLTVPRGWLVQSTGTLQNPVAVLSAKTRERLSRAMASDEPVAIRTATERPERVEREPTVTWTYRAENVRDVAFSASAAYVWDAVRASVGDRDGDGQDDYALAQALYRPEEESWAEAATYAKFSVEHLSELLIPYPYAHMTAVEGIIGGGMEFPMMTLISGGRSPRSLFGVTYHEIAHEWFPMIVGQDEKAFTWMDEGLVSYLTNVGVEAYFPEEDVWQRRRQYHYLLAGTGRAVPPMRHGDRFPVADGAVDVNPTQGLARVVASYSTPAVALRALEAIHGREAVLGALQGYVQRWAYKHPYPRDFFATMDALLGAEHDYFWKGTFYEAWPLDHAIMDVRQGEDVVTVEIQDRGLQPFPAFVTATYADGRTAQAQVPVETWLSGATTATVTFPPGALSQITLDPDGYLVDVDQTNDVWRPAGGQP